MSDITFEAFPKIPRLKRGCVITEKIDGTNAQVIITEDGQIGAASRSRLIVPGDDNYGFAAWVHENKEDLLKLGPGRHFGEWWGRGIQRNYGLDERRFSLFNTHRWGLNPDRPACCSVVPLLYTGDFTTTVVDEQLELLRENGSAATQFDKPEGVVVFHAAGNHLYKVLLENDNIPKGLTK